MVYLSNQETCSPLTGKAKEAIPSFGPLQVGGTYSTFNCHSDYQTQLRTRRDWKTLMALHGGSHL